MISTLLDILPTLTLRVQSGRSAAEVSYQHQLLLTPAQTLRERLLGKLTRSHGTPLGIGTNQKVRVCVVGGG
jgi:hypothetical protein